MSGSTAIRVGIVVLFCAAGLAQAQTRFTVVDSSPTSWVARGYSNYTVTPALGWAFTVTTNPSNVIRFHTQGDPLPGTNVDYWEMRFAAPFNALIVPGFYPDFQRYPFQAPDRPGLSFSSTGRLDNQASGFFEVYEATYAPGGELLTFAADFTHYGETNPANWAIVEVRYNTSVPAPAAAALALLAIPLTARRRR